MQTFSVEASEIRNLSCFVSDKKEIIEYLLQYIHIEYNGTDLIGYATNGRIGAMQKLTIHESFEPDKFPKDGINIRPLTFNVADDSVLLIDDENSMVYSPRNPEATCRDLDYFVIHSFKGSPKYPNFRRMFDKIDLSQYELGLNAPINLGLLNDFPKQYYKNYRHAYSGKATNGFRFYSHKGTWEKAIIILTDDPRFVAIIMPLHNVHSFDIDIDSFMPV